MNPVILLRSACVGRCLWVALLSPLPSVASAAGPTDAAASLPKDVSRFIQRRDACDHFRGEEPYDAERRTDLEQQMRKFCTGTDAQLRALKHKYRNRPAVTGQLGGYDPAIE